MYKTATPKTHEQKLDEVLSYIERNYIEPYGNFNDSDLTEAMAAKVELASTIKWLINSF